MQRADQRRCSQQSIGERAIATWTDGLRRINLPRVAQGGQNAILPPLALPERRLRDTILNLWLSRSVQCHDFKHRSNFRKTGRYAA